MLVWSDLSTNLDYIMEGGIDALQLGWSEAPPWACCEACFKFKPEWWLACTAVAAACDQGKVLAVEVLLIEVYLFCLWPYAMLFGVDSPTSPSCCYMCSGLFCPSCCGSSVFGAGVYCSSGWLVLYDQLWGVDLLVALLLLQCLADMLRDIEEKSYIYHGFTGSPEHGELDWPDDSESIIVVDTKKVGSDTFIQGSVQNAERISGKSSRSDTWNQALFKQSNVNMLLLLLGLLCLLLPLMCRYGAIEHNTLMAASSILQLSRAGSIIMLLAYVSYLFFQLKTHRQLFDSQEVILILMETIKIYSEFYSESEVDDGASEEEKAVIGFWSAFIWLFGMTVIIAWLSEYIVSTIEAASDSWGISVGFVSVILLPIVGNATEHAGSIIFALKNKLDISLAVALGSAAQIFMFVVPLCVVVAWIMGVHMDLDFNLLETGALAFSIIVTSFALQDGNSHYMKGVVLCLCYTVIAACFFVHKIVLDQKAVNNLEINPTSGVLAA
ncbi:hypothetical protein TEA_025664 [Camellia sinensis var. sinensis]|uniref:Sodium/calcium exchanger membrane region domain-containing protein n=1 Tax=Camellia sinensis var. sinensis TaxID=542762 RepID=A0A4S4F090_CAMSN|nr:hypothetical protein TEA_025664 [Camellia sinensis var. sinensis]